LVGKRKKEKKKKVLHFNQKSALKQSLQHRSLQWRGKKGRANHKKESAMAGDPTIKHTKSPSLKRSKKLRTGERRPAAPIKKGVYESKPGTLLMTPSKGEKKRSHLLTEKGGTRSVYC